MQGSGEGSWESAECNSLATYPTRCPHGVFGFWGKITFRALVELVASVRAGHGG